MSLERLRVAFGQMNECENWSLQLLRIKTSRNKAVDYEAFSINLSPQGKLTELVEEISNYYVGNDKSEIDSYQCVRDYDGTAESDKIYRLNASNPLICEGYAALAEALAHVEQEADPLKQKLQAYVIGGDVNIDGEETAIKMISMQNPITTLKHKFLQESNSFKEITSKVLSLRKIIDVLILGDEIFFFSMAGERLFDMERAYRAVCESKVAMLEQSEIIYNKKAFGIAARTGHHPRMFVSFNEKRFQKLKNAKERKRYAEFFNISFRNGMFDASEPEDADKLVKLLCNKGMADPFENRPVEVSGATKWE